MAEGSVALVPCGGVTAVPHEVPHGGAHWLWQGFHQDIFGSSVAGVDTGACCLEERMEGCPVEGWVRQELGLEGDWAPGCVQEAFFYVGGC